MNTGRHGRVEKSIVVLNTFAYLVDILACNSIRKIHRRQNITVFFSLKRFARRMAKNDTSVHGLWHRWRICCHQRRSVETKYFCLFSRYFSLKPFSARTLPMTAPENSRFVSVGHGRHILSLLNWYPTFWTKVTPPVMCIKPAWWIELVFSTVTYLSVYTSYSCSRKLCCFYSVYDVTPRAYAVNPVQLSMMTLFTALDRHCRRQLLQFHRLSLLFVT